VHITEICCHTWNTQHDFWIQRLNQLTWLTVANKKYTVKMFAQYHDAIFKFINKLYFLNNNRAINLANVLSQLSEMPSTTTQLVLTERIKYYQLYPIDQLISEWLFESCYHQSIIACSKIVNTFKYTYIEAMFFKYWLMNNSYIEATFLKYWLMNNWLTRTFK